MNRLLALLITLGLTACAEANTRYWPDGVKRFEGHGQVGREEGEWNYWYFDGQLRERGQFEHGQRHGIWKQWFPDGQRASIGERRYDEARDRSPREGLWNFWHENGQMRAQGQYVAGKRHGSWTVWKVRGQRDPEASGVYEHGVRLP